MTFLANWAMLSHGWQRFLLCLVAGLVAGLSVPPLFVLPALFVAMPIWVWCLDGAEQRKSIWGKLFGPAFAIGFAFGWGYFIVAFHWLGAAFSIEGGGWVIWSMPLAIAALAALIAFFWGLASALAHLFWSHGPWRVVVLAASLSAFEFVRGHLFTGFPFDLLGYALTANDDMAQLASVIGVYGLTQLAALLAMTPALIWPTDNRSLPRRLAPFFVAMLAIAGQVGFGAWRLANTEVTPRDDIKLRLVQPAIYEHADWSRANPADIVERLVGLSETRTGPNDPGLSGVTHLVWPESAFPFFLSEYPEALARFARMLPDNVTLLTGAPREDYNADPGNPGYNAVLAINTDGELVASYDKSHLVPFGEYLPFQNLFSMIGIRQFVPGTNGWAPGNGQRLMSVPNTPAFLALICYEAIFSGDLGADIGKAEFILNITNDAWFDGSIGPAQHAHHVKIRAVEEGKPLIRAANTGLTFATDPLGRVTAAIAPQEMGLVDVVPAHPLPPTLFAQWRHWPFLGFELLGLLIAVVTRRKAPRA